VHHVGFSLNEYIEMRGQQNVKPRSTAGHGRLNNKFVYMCNTFIGTPGLGQCKHASKPDVLFYSASNLLPSCGVQSVQRTEGNSTTKSCLKSSAE
jgi:hypothetical protein